MLSDCKVDEESLKESEFDSNSEVTDNSVRCRCLILKER